MDKIIEALHGLFTLLSESQISSVSYVPTKPYSGGLPSKTVKTGSKGTDVKHVQKFLNWCMKSELKVDGKCGKYTVAAIKKYQKQYGLKVDGIFGSQSKSKAKKIIAKYESKPAPKPVSTTTSGASKIVAKANEYAWAYGTAASKYSYSKGSPKSAYKAALKTYMGKSAKVTQSDCGYFVATCVRASGVAKSFKALPSSNKKAYPDVPSTMKIVHKGKKIPSGLLKAGDVIRYKKTSGQHTMIYMGNGRIAEAQRSSASKGKNFPAIKKDTKKYNSSNVKHSTIQVLRAK